MSNRRNRSSSSEEAESDDSLDEEDQALLKDKQTNESPNMRTITPPTKPVTHDKLDTIALYKKSSV